jgi:beta-glucanase (GH16 family)
LKDHLKDTPTICCRKEKNNLKETFAFASVLLFVFLLFSACEDDNRLVPPDDLNPVDTIPAPEGYALVWHDEFDLDGLPDSNLWIFEHGPNWHNNEQQYYTNKRLENCRIINGKMIIEAIPEVYDTRSYTSARINSNTGWRYGFFEVSAKLPRGVALWPAIWLYPDEDSYGGWPKSGEIDMMENWSWAPETIYGTIHTEAYNHIQGTQKGGAIEIPEPWSEFYRYQLEWQPGMLKWFVNDSLFFTFENEGTVQTWPFDHFFHFILNVAVEQHAPGNESSWVKRTMEIDYVRVFQKKS